MRGVEKSERQLSAPAGSRGGCVPPEAVFAHPPAQPAAWQLPASFVPPLSSAVPSSPRPPNLPQGSCQGERETIK